MDGYAEDTLASELYIVFVGAIFEPNEVAFTIIGYIDLTSVVDSEPRILPDQMVIYYVLSDDQDAVGVHVVPKQENSLLDVDSCMADMVVVYASIDAMVVIERSKVPVNKTSLNVLIELNA